MKHVLVTLTLIIYIAIASYIYIILTGHYYIIQDIRLYYIILIVSVTVTIQCIHVLRMKPILSYLILSFLAFIYFKCWHVWHMCSVTAVGVYLRQSKSYLRCTAYYQQKYFAHILQK